MVRWGSRRLRGCGPCRGGEGHGLMERLVLRLSGVLCDRHEVGARRGVPCLAGGGSGSGLGELAWVGVRDETGKGVSLFTAGGACLDIRGIGETVGSLSLVTARGTRLGVGFDDACDG
jgi:hypothetical protein